MRLSLRDISFNTVSACNISFVVGVFQFFTGNISPTKKSVDVGWGKLDQNWTEMKTMFKTPERENQLVLFTFMESLKDRKQFRHNMNFTVLPVAYPIGICFR